MNNTKITFIKILILGFSIFFFSWFIVSALGVNTLKIQSEDTLPAMFLPLSIIKERSLYLDTYYDMLVSKYPHPDDKNYELGMTPFYLRKVDSHYVSAFPIITGILAVPVYLLPVLLGMPINWDNLALTSHIGAALIMAISGGFFYLLLKKHFDLDERKSTILTIIYLFGTVNFAMISQALWQHGTLQMFMILGLIFLLNVVRYSSENPKFLFVNTFMAGLFMSLGVLSRPTGALAFIFIFGLFFLKYSCQAKRFANGAIGYFSGLFVVALFFLLYNNTFYESIANQGYSNQLGNSWLGNFPESFFGIWLSPSKGILVYSPVLVFALIGYVIALKRSKESALEYSIYATIVLSHTLVMSFWKHWFGGWSFGYRMSSDVLPFLVLLLVPFMQSALYKKYVRIFIFLVCFSIFVQVFGIIFFDGVWHAAYDLGYKDTSWLWSIKDSEFMFNVRRVLVKFGVLVSACPKCLPN